MELKKAAQEWAAFFIDMWILLIIGVLLKLKDFSLRSK